ncbi:serine/threonine-protein kinase [Streptomyces sp. NPDC090112]|uniref:serine/threonine-protein kinase n=1 Tax=Streptomyces sp. NPDC090112 TaxID=3365949 RepID=UPI0037F73206
MERLHPYDPHRIGTYRLLSRLGSGSTGQVYLARGDRGRTVAVKLVHHGLGAREEFRVRLRQEVAAVRRAGGAWTAPVLAADTETAAPWVATAHVAGPSLHQVVAHDFGPLPAPSVRVLAAGLAYALRDVHRAGLVHRALRPSHVLLSLDGPRVVDFGISRAATGSPAFPSPGFTAPEQLRGGPATAAGDVFRLGAVLAYAATGRLPSGEVQEPGSPPALLLRGTEAERDLARLPPDLYALVRDCLDRDPGARPQPDEVLERIGASKAVADGRALDPWLPPTLVAQLGRHAVRLLDREDAGPDRPAPPQPPAVPPSYSVSPAPETESPAGPSRTASTAVLLAVAAVVAVLSAGTVDAVMNGSEDPRPPVSGARKPTTSPTTSPTSPPGASGPSVAAAPADPGGPSGTLPGAYLGSWQAVRGTQTWRLTLTPGSPGERVMALTVEDPGFTCAWTAPLLSASGPVELDASTVTSGAPPTCTPGVRSRLLLRPDGTLRREPVSGGAPALDYTRA